jgi:hypothetical protein
MNAVDVMIGVAKAIFALMSLGFIVAMIPSGEDGQ